MISDVYVCRVLHFIVSAGWWSDFASDVYWYVCNVIYLVTIWTAHHWPSQLPPNLLSIFPHASVCHVAGKMDIWAAEINNTWHENYRLYVPSTHYQYVYLCILLLIAGSKSDLITLLTDELLWKYLSRLVLGKLSHLGLLLFGLRSFIKLNGWLIVCLPLEHIVIILSCHSLYIWLLPSSHSKPSVGSISGEGTGASNRLIEHIGALLNSRVFEKRLQKIKCMRLIMLAYIWLLLSSCIGIIIPLCV